MIKGFTILELLVTLVLSGIVTGICFTGYEMISKQSVLLETVVESEYKTDRFFTCFESDVFNSLDFHLNKSSIRLYKAGGDFVTYHMYQDKVIRRYKGAEFEFKIIDTRINITDNNHIEISISGSQHQLTRSFVIIN